MRLRFLLASLAGATTLLLLLGSCGGAQSDSSTGVERVVLIVCDTLRADRLGLYGYERDTSPRLDALAREAVVYDEAYASAPMTVPAMASVMTGRFPQEVGVTPGNFRLIPAEVETLAERLQAHGVKTAAVVSNPVLTRRGAGTPGGFEQGFDHFDAKMSQREKVRKAMWERPAPDTTDAAIDWLEQAKTAGDERFFLWVHYQDPHGPYTPPADYAERFDSGHEDSRRVRVGSGKLGRGVIPHYQNLDGEQRVDVYRDLYDAEIAYFDEHVGRLLDWLRDNDLDDGTLIVFTADHGEALGEHEYWFCHGESVYRDVVRVPFVVRYPDGARAPAATQDADGFRRVASLVGHVDIRPTIEAAFGIEPGSRRGQALIGADVPTGRVLPQRLLPDESRAKWEAFSDGRYRVVWHEEEKRYRLFDILDDPGETVDLAPGNPARVEALLDAFKAYEAATREAVRVDQAEVEEMDEERRKLLESLGYVDGGADNDDAETEGSEPK